MISRKSARLIAEAYSTHFSSNSPIYNPSTGGIAFAVKQDEINEFLFDEGYDDWFLYIMRGMVDTSAKLKKAIMQLHTGETIQNSKKAIESKISPKMGQPILKKLAEDIFKLYESIPVEEVDFSSARDQEDLKILQAIVKIARPADDMIKQLKSQLEIDGYIYRDGVLYSVESAVIDVQAEQNYLEILVDMLGMGDPTTIKHHIQLAEEHYVNGRYSDSIGNSRHFLEAILSQTLQQVITKLGTTLHSNVYRNATETRNHLERHGLLTQDEKETIGRIYGLLSNTGGHAYIAQKDQARLMWHLALTCSQFVLLRYEGFLKAHP